MYKLIRSSLLTGALSIALGTGAAYGDSISASLFSPLPPAGKLTPIDLSGVSTPSHGTITGNGYTITFSTPGNQGVVHGDLGGVHAVPVAGVSSSKTPLYLTGDYGSSLTANVLNSGNYLSTGLGTITITFSSPQRSLALLWGSIDTGNSLTLNDAAHYVVTGSAVQKAAAGFASNGFQGPGGSAYVIVDAATPFTTITAASSVVSFEFAGVAGDSGLFSNTPEPSSLALLGLGGLLTFFGLRRRRSSQPQE